MEEEDQLERVVASPSSAVEDNMPADEYARRHGLSVDANFDIKSLLVFAATALGVFDWPESLQDGPLRQLKLPTIEPLQESLELSQTVSPEILAQIINPAEVVEVSDVAAAHASTSGRAKQPKLPLPLLRSDHEFDCQELLWSIKDRTSTNLGTRNLPYEPLDASSDEAPEYPPHAQVYHRELERDATKHDRVKVSKDVLSCLSDVLRDGCRDEDFQNLLAEQLDSPMASTARLSLVPQCYSTILTCAKSH